MDVRHRYAWTVVLSLFLLSGCAARTTGVKETDTATARDLVVEAEQVLAKYLADPGGEALKPLLSRAKGMMIIPSAGEFGFLLTIGGGRGLLLANTDGGWTGPVFMARSSLGWGWQAGGYSRTGLVLFMHEDDVRYVMETGFVFKGHADLVIFNCDDEYGRSPEFRESGDVYFVGEKAGLFAGVAFDTGGYSDRPTLNEALSGVPGGDPETVLYTVGARPEAAARLRELIAGAALEGATTKEKDGTEVPSD
ncbi:lipid-binding SYLF domain-containing protein [Pseudodesulfovibrio portus]|uniref:Ysc84 actin-binding domain-containing protein n=1 Tax=Pseudodesulfovibrio portus TaxID=231439 RepID=A0ABM8AP78_9BACT|nr:lipid-binding SYLF domain-containing protein [Pseudodesulfovibrio portus]BDQ33175.1 hypothetical protein JCM14722_07170 [Pseudodesulfovibrio portus]